MNPVDLLLCILGVFALVLPVVAVDAGELAREGLPGVPVRWKPVGDARVREGHRSSGYQRLRPLGWMPMPTISPEQIRMIDQGWFAGLDTERPEEVRVPALEQPLPPPPFFPRLELGDPLYDPAIDGTTLHLEPVDWSKPAPPSDPIADIKKAANRDFPDATEAADFWRKASAHMDQLAEDVRAGKKVVVSSPPLSHEAATIQELVIASAGRMDLDELLIVLEDSFDIHLSPEAAEAAARTVPDLEVEICEGDAARVFVIPQKSLTASERRALEKYIHAGLVDLRREQPAETWDSFVDSLPLAKKGEPSPKVQRATGYVQSLESLARRAHGLALPDLREALAVVDLPRLFGGKVPESKAPSAEESDPKEEARELLSMLHAWEQRAPRTERQLHALQDFGAIVERDAFPLHIVSTEADPERTYRKTILPPCKVSVFVGEEKIAEGEMDVGKPVKQIIEKHLIPLKQEPNGTWTGTAPLVPVREGETISTRVFVREQDGKRIAELNVYRDERAPCSAGHPDTEDCPRCRGAQAGGDMPPTKLRFDNFIPRPFLSASRTPAWSTDLACSMARGFAEHFTALGKPTFGAAFLHVAEQRLTKPAQTAFDMAIFCQRILGYVPEAVALNVAPGLMKWRDEDRRWAITLGLPGWIHATQDGSTRTACGKVFADKACSAPVTGCSHDAVAGPDELIPLLFSCHRAEVTCPACADTWIAS